MALKTRIDYLAALRELRPNIYKFGELIEDVTSHPATKRTVESHALNYDAANDPELEDTYTATSVFSGQKILRWNSMMQSSDDLIANLCMKRQNYRRTGSCTGAVCVGWNAMNVMWAVCSEMDEEFGTDYQARLKNWILSAEERGITVAGALTDAKGNRSLKPSEQPDPDTNLRIVEDRDDGIVIRGAKLMICGTAASQEVFLLPGGIYGEADPQRPQGARGHGRRGMPGHGYHPGLAPVRGRLRSPRAGLHVPGVQVHGEVHPVLHRQLPGLHRWLRHGPG
jgi:4-hydroxybutyryl-CoA dehydratase/vinylacetyl-CoA-Delta-isomerase